MSNPLIDQRHFEKGPWRRELIWVQRNALGIIVGIEERMPEAKNVNLDLPANLTLKEGEKPDEHVYSDKDGF